MHVHGFHHKQTKRSLRCHISEQPPIIPLQAAVQSSPVFVPNGTRQDVWNKDSLMTCLLIAFSYNNYACALNREQMEKAGQGHIAETLVTLLEHAWGIKFEEGHNKNIKFMVRRTTQKDYSEGLLS